MGLLKEALKTLCGDGWWSYAVFWKIGCQNPKLLIWEEYHFEPAPCFNPPPQLSGMDNTDLPFGEFERCWVSTQSQSSEVGSQAGDRVHALLNKMMMNNQVNVVGEGIVGRAAFTGLCEWILSNSYIEDAHPPKVVNEVNNQFAVGMQTLVIIPVLPHGVVQLGSPFLIPEDVGFVNDVKSLILQLGCIPGSLLSDNYAPVSFETLVSMDLSETSKEVNSTQLLSSQKRNFSKDSGLVGLPSYSLLRHIPDSPQFNVSMSQNLNLTRKLTESLDDCSQPKVTLGMKPKLPCTFHVGNGSSAEMIPLDPDACLNKQASSWNWRTFNCKQGISQPHARQIERQNLSDVNNTIAESSSIESQLRTDGDKDFIDTVFLDGINSHYKPSYIVPSEREAVTFSNLVDQSTARHMHSGVSEDTHHSTDLNYILTETPQEQMIENDLFQAFCGPLTPLDGHTSNFKKHDGKRQNPGPKNVKCEEAFAQMPSGDDLFDILGVDFRNKLLNRNWNNFLADGIEASNQNLGTDPSAFVNQAASSGFHSTTDGGSSSGIFSDMGTDNLLEAVVSKSHTATKQSTDDDDVSCKTTMTKISRSTVPSSFHTYGRVNMLDPVEGEIFGGPKSLSKGVNMVSSSFRSGNSEELGNSCQTTSIHDSQISSWVDQSDNVKRDSIVSTAFSRKPSEINKTTRKRLKPGENPRPRPKDRQMIQDRVKELREIIPNGSKCSIDALLERTIKHMLFLQSVTKHADKLKHTGESKIVNKEDGLVLKDNLGGGATWAFEVGSQSMVCPIIVEDLKPPRQMLVEILCEERGFFLEIADLIRGLGLSILKGVMEAKNEKIWARFVVEANRDVNRMEIFLSLVQLLEQTVKGISSSANAIDKNMMLHSTLPGNTAIPATGRPL